MKLALLAIATTSLLTVNLNSAAHANPFDALTQPSIRYLGDLNPSARGNYIPEVFSESMVISGRYCPNLPLNSNFYHVDLDFDSIDNSGSNTKFKAFAHVKLSQSKDPKSGSIADQLYLVTGKYLDGRIHLETAKPVSQSEDKNENVAPILTAALGHYSVYRLKAGINERVQGHIEKHPEGVSCYSTQIFSDTKYTKAERKQLFNDIRKKLKNKKHHATASTMFMDTIPISGKNSPKKVDKLLKKIGAKFISTEHAGVLRKDVYDVAQAIPGIGKVIVYYTPFKSSEYLATLHIEIPASPEGTPESDMPVVQIRDSLLKKYGKPTKGNPSVKAAWKRHDGTEILFVVKRELFAPARAEIFYANDEMLDIASKLGKEKKKSTYNKF